MIVGGYLYGIMIIGLFFLMVLFRKLINKEGIKSFNIHFDKRGFRLLFIGMLIGTIFTFIYILIIVAARQCNINISWRTISNTIQILLVSLFIFLSIALFEEGLYRGYIMQKINKRFSITAGILVSSIFFGIYHVIPYYGNSHLWIGVINVMLYGVFLSIISLKYNSNMLNIGFHFIWDVINSMIFSGYNLKMETLIQINIKEGIVAGANATPETGLVMTLMLSLLLVLTIRKTKNIIPNNIDFL